MGPSAPRLRGCFKTPQWLFKLSPGWFCFHLGSRKLQKTRFPQPWQNVRWSAKAGLFWNPSGSWVTRPLSKRNFKEGPALPGEAGLRALREGSTTQTSEKTNSQGPCGLACPSARSLDGKGAPTPGAPQGWGQRGAAVPGLPKAHPHTLCPGGVRAEPAALGEEGKTLLTPRTQAIPPWLPSERKPT